MVLCHLAGLHADVSRPALQALLVLLCNRFPKVLPLPTSLSFPACTGQIWQSIAEWCHICRCRRQSVHVGQLKAAACTVNGCSQV